MNAAVYDAIGRYEYSFKWEKDLENKTRKVEYFLEELTLVELRGLLADKAAVSVELVKHEVSFCCEGSAIEVSIEMEYNLTQDEKKEELHKCLNYRKNAVIFVRRWIHRKPEQTESVLKVLKSKNLEMFLK